MIKSAAAQDSMDAGHELAEGEGFKKIIVGAGIEGVDYGGG